MRDLYEIAVTIADDNDGLRSIQGRPAHSYFTLRGQAGNAITYPDAFGQPSVEEVHEAWVYTTGVIGRLLAVVAVELPRVIRDHGCWDHEDVRPCGVRIAEHLIAPGHLTEPAVGPWAEVAVPYEHRVAFLAWLEGEMACMSNSDG